MRLSVYGSRTFNVDLLADFILNKIGQNEQSTIKVVDCENFTIIKGKTSSKQVLDLSKVIEEFNIKNMSEKKKITNIIDLIEYDQKMEIVESIYHTYFDTQNCSYHQNQIKSFENGHSSDEIFVNDKSIERMVVSSQFPFGHSLKSGRILYYYGKHIFYSLPCYYFSNLLTFKISNKKDDKGEVDFHVFDINGIEDEILTSSILDVFDFEFGWLENEIKKVDWSIELTDPLLEYDFIKKINKDLIIL